MKRLLFDTESDGFVATSTKVHCVAAIDVDTKERFNWLPTQIDEAVAALDKADVLIGHNIQRHDVPLLTKLKGFKLRPGVQLRDTMIIARLKHPNIKNSDKDLARAGTLPTTYVGKHSLGAWGYRLNCHKGDYAQIRQAEALAAGITDPKALARYVWGTWTQEMQDYMVQDCETNLTLWDHLDPDNYSLAAIELEHRIANVCNAMEQAGVPFDTKKAAALHVDLVTQAGVIEERLKEQFGFWYASEKPSHEASVHTPKVNNSRYGYVKGQPYTKLKIVTFNPGSRDHIAHVLRAKGWKPTKFTDGGKAQFDEEVLQSVVAEFPEMESLDRYFMLEKRLSQLVGGKQSWLNHVVEDGPGGIAMIHGAMNPMGTATSRAAHFAPNLGQVPNAASPYGPECRELFYAPPGFTFLGADMSGLELRGLAHYLAPLDGGAYMKVVCEGDVHWMHAQAMGLVGEGVARDHANKLHTIVREDGSKRFIYAYIYGAWDDMCGQILYDCLVKCRRDGGPEGVALYDKFFPNGIKSTTLRNTGSKVRASFSQRIAGYAKLQERLLDQVKRFGWVYGLDDRKIPTRSEHSALNFLIQSCGAILCKRWLCDVYEELCSKYKWGWDGDFVMNLWVHDEGQLCVRKGLEEEISAIIVKHAQLSGTYYGFRGPLDSSTSLKSPGRNWRDTH